MMMLDERLVQKQANPDFISRFTRTVTVETVEPDNESGWDEVEDESNWRRVTVTVTHTNARDKTIPVGRVQRIFAYVPVSP